jgi:hypothetical protein
MTSVDGLTLSNLLSLLKSCKGMDLGSKREGGREGGRERGRQCLGAGLSECRSQ